MDSVKGIGNSVSIACFVAARSRGYGFDHFFEIVFRARDRKGVDDTSGRKEEILILLPRRIKVFFFFFEINSTRIDAYD